MLDLEKLRPQVERMADYLAEQDRQAREIVSGVELAWASVDKPCPYCSGTGASKYFLGGKCGYCNQTGVIKVARLVEVKNETAGMEE